MALNISVTSTGQRKIAKPKTKKKVSIHPMKSWKYHHLIITIIIIIILLFCW